MSDQPISKNELFKADVLSGLRRRDKRLSSKYFYDKTGDELFQKIMKCEDYYLTNCEMQIFRDKTAELAAYLMNDDRHLDIIELGSGDGTKSYHLLKYLKTNYKQFHYYPIDISQHILNILKQKLQNLLPDVDATYLEGEYFEMLEKIKSPSQNKRLILFLGSSIGNMTTSEAVDFCKTLRGHLSKNDLALIGFDLKKNPKTILKAYSDSEGLTARFNLNLLTRINRELDADFNPEQFEHYQTYDPETGACKSYLISNFDQQVSIADETVQFKKDETIFMEISQKFNFEDIESIADASGFSCVYSCSDNRGWFADSYLKAI